METAIDVGRAIAKSSKDPLGVIASSDLVHYGSRFGYNPVKGSKEEILSWVKKNDMEILKRAEELDTEGLYKFINSKDYTTCGYGPFLPCLRV